MVQRTIQVQRKKIGIKRSDKFVSGYVIYSGDLTPEIDGIKSLNFKNTASAIS